MEERSQIRPQWNNLFLRIQQAARQHTGVAWITVRICTDNGLPFWWLPPESVPIEPKVSVRASDLIEKMTEAQMKQLFDLVFKQVSTEK